MLQQQERSAELTIVIPDPNADVPAPTVETKESPGKKGAAVIALAPADAGVRAAAAQEEADSFEVIDDPVRVYLREIGRIPLLTAADERRLALEHASGRHVEVAEAEILLETGRQPLPFETIKLLLKRLESRAWLLEAIAEYRAIEEPLTLSMLLTNELLRQAIDGQVDQEMLEHAALAFAQRRQNFLDMLA